MIHQVIVFYYVKNGGGLVVVHAGLTIDGSACPAPAYIEAVGSYFVNHPPREMTHVTITAENEITRGAAYFSERDEHYQLAVIAEDIESFMRTEYKHGGVGKPQLSAAVSERDKICGRMILTVPVIVE